jgi:hypothetical protein
METDDNWIVREGRDPAKELKSLQKRFAAITNRYERAAKVRQFLHAARLPFLAGCAVFVIAFLALGYSPFSPLDTVRHLAAFPNCAAAHAVGLAPSSRGLPGYWAHLDKDQDGIACEGWGT